jgi:high-affinity iron transporter
MGASFLITLREGLEVSLVLAILVSYLVKSGRASDVGAVWRGSAAAALVCLLSGIAFNIFVGEFSGKSEQFIEGTIAIVAASVLTWMIFWFLLSQHPFSSSSASIAVSFLLLPMVLHLSLLASTSFGIARDVGFTSIRPF